MNLLSPVLLLSALLPLTLAHGIVTTPTPRSHGPLSLSYCGPSLTSIIRSDNQSGIEDLIRASSTDPVFDASKCNLRVCKGLQLDDNLENVQQWYPGQIVNVKVWAAIPHKGWVSVAIVETGSIPFLVGEPLITFETESVGTGYLVERKGREVDGKPVDYQDFNVTIPKNLGGRCAVPGDCVLMWTWFGRVVHQTYESCVDFMVGSEDEDDLLWEGEDVGQKLLVQDALN